MSGQARLREVGAGGAALELDEKRFSRLGWGLVLLGFVGFLLWAGLAPLDKGVGVSGTVMVAGSRKAVQHPTGGLVRHIRVHEGERVEAGQVLLEMDATQARAQADGLFRAEGDELDVSRQFLAKRGSLVAAVEAHRFAEQAGADAESGRQGRVRFVHRCRLPRGKEVRAQLDSQAVIRHILELILYRSMYLYRYFLVTSGRQATARSPQRCSSRRRAASWPLSQAPSTRPLEHQSPQA